MIFFIDVDGVLANFTQATIDSHKIGCDYSSCNNWNYFEDWGLTPAQFWSKCRGKAFWENLELYSDAHATFNTVKQYEYYVVTTPSDDPECPQAKVEWLKRHFGIPLSKIILGKPKHLLAGPDRMLIDDSPENIENFVVAGGLGYGWDQPWNDFSGNSIELAEMIETFNMIA